MTHEAERTFNPSSKQVTALRGIGQKAVENVAKGKTEFFAMGLMDRIKLRGVPSLLIQEAMYEACRADGSEIQSFLPYSYKGDSAAEFSPLTVRVIGGEGIPGFLPLEENQPIQGMPGSVAISVYPPPEQLRNR